MTIPTTVLMRVVLLLSCAWTGATGKAAVVGSLTYRVVPTGAELLSGTNADGWLSTDPDPLGFEEAMTNPSVLDSGWGNLDQGTVIEFRFGPRQPVPNLPGADLVLLEARFDSGSYVLSTEFDGFAAETPLGPADFLDTGLERDYYFGRSTQGAARGRIFQAEIDLSSLGVPAGVSIRRIRIRTVDERSDLLGVAAQVPEPTPALLLLGLGLGLIWHRRGPEMN